MNRDQSGLIEFPHVTAVIPVYNEENCIKDCILSLFNQDFDPLETIVVDDGSTDGTVHICRNLGIKVIRQKHKGPGAARNLGAKNSNGNILLFIDADMIFEPDYISKLVSPIVNEGEIATCHWHERVANWENPWARCQTWFLGLEDGMRHPARVADYEAVYRAVRKDFFLKSGGFSENEGRGDDSSIFRHTGVGAKIVEDAVCLHKNFETLREVWIDSQWHGKQVTVRGKSKLRCVLRTLFLDKNPFFHVIRGATLAIKKKEPRLVPYAAVYTAGHLLGLGKGFLLGHYIK